MWLPSLPSLDSIPLLRRIHIPHAREIRHVVYGIVLGVSLSLATSSVVSTLRERKRKRIEHVHRLESRPIQLRSDEVLHNGVLGLIGNTPLIRIASLSDALGVEILGKAEWLNPGGSVKDRVALRMIEDAEQTGLLVPNTGSRIFEGTVGSTGISIATVGRAKGYDTTIIMPDDVAVEKVKTLEALGADIIRVRPASIVDKKQFVNLARKYATDFGRHPDPPSMDGAKRGHLPTSLERPHLLKTATDSVVVSTVADVDADGDGIVDDIKEKDRLRAEPRGFFADQFENRSNYTAHLTTTGPEIWRQTNGQLHAFVSGSGTGGTLAGIGRYLKSMDEDVRVVMPDPDGSGLYNKVKHGVMFDSKEAEGTKRRHQVDTVVEGIGINRLTKNFELALPIVDDAYRVSDAEAVAMSRYLVAHDGLFLGSSSACNLVACIRLVDSMKWRGSGKRVVTILCDSGSRHYSKFWDGDYLANAGIPVDVSIIEKMLANK